jgi:ABC-type sugar transport system substrate-binding protein
LRHTRILGIAALAAIVVGACSSSASSPAASSAVTGKTWNLTLIQGVKGDPFYVTMACGAQAEATKLGAKLTVTGGDKWDASVQTPVVDSVTASKPNGVMIAPNDGKAMFAPLKAMNDAGVNVTLVDTGLEDTSFAKGIITSNNAQGGQVGATTLAKLIGDKGTVLVVNVDPGITTTDARVKGFNDEMAKHTGVNLLPVQFTHDDPTIATQIATSTLAAHPDLAGIFATNVNTAEGVAAALKQVGNTSVKIIAFDAGPKQVQDLKDGIVSGLIAQDPYQEGILAVDAAVDALNGKTAANTQTELAAITKDNLDDPTVKKFLYLSACS